MLPSRACMSEPAGAMPSWPANEWSTLHSPRPGHAVNSAETAGAAGGRGSIEHAVLAFFGEAKAAWVMGGLWSFWHLPAYFFPGTSHHDFMPMLPSLVFTACFGVFIARVFSRAGGSIIATMAAHLAL